MAYSKANVCEDNRELQRIHSSSYFVFLGLACLYDDSLFPGSNSAVLTYVYITAG